jgi:hypothetical protein
MIATTRLLTIPTLLTLLFGFALIDRADGAPFRPRPYSEEARQILKDSCKEKGGSSFETNYQYGYGGKVPTSVTTRCHYPDGSTGPTCTVGAVNVTCSKSTLPADETGPFGALSGDTVIEVFDTSSSQTADPADGALAPSGSIHQPTDTAGTFSATAQAEDEDDEGRP